jgi:hypothetical protein
LSLAAALVFIIAGANTRAREFVLYSSGYAAACKELDDVKRIIFESCMVKFFDDITSGRLIKVDQVLAYITTLVDAKQWDIFELTCLVALKGENSSGSTVANKLSFI